MIKPGDRLPPATFKIKTGDGTSDLDGAAYFAGRLTVLFGVPGAFTPTCHRNHLPGYLDNLDALHERGVDQVAVMAVNDHHVMKAWAEATGGDGRIDFLADGSAKFAQALGLVDDRTDAGMGLRARRFSMIVDDGVVKRLNVEDMPGVVTNSGVSTILDQLAEDRETAS
jgi:peroxiredoxin